MAYVKFFRLKQMTLCVFICHNHYEGKGSSWSVMQVCLFFCKIYNDIKRYLSKIVLSASLIHSISLKHYSQYYTFFKYQFLHIFEFLFFCCCHVNQSNGLDLRYSTLIVKDVFMNA